MRMKIATHCRLFAVLLAASRVVASAEAASFKVSAIRASVSFELKSFVAGGISYSQADLVHATLADYSGRGGLQIPEGASIPQAGTRAQLIDGDFQLNTGISNAREVKFAFSPTLINGPGPDLVYFNEGYFGPADLEVEVGDVKVTYVADFYDVRLLATKYHQYFRTGDAIVNLAQLEADPYPINTSISGSSISYVSGLAIDLDDFSIAPMASITDVTFRRPATSPDALDPLLLMGIRSTAAPEPNAALLAVMALAALGRPHCVWRDSKALPLDCSV